MVWILGADTEATGAYPKHGCRPFFTSGWDNSERQYSWEWTVDKETRIPYIPQRDVREIEDLFNAVDRLILWNCKFDYRMWRSIGVRMPPWNKIYDGMTELHVLDSSEVEGTRLGLKLSAAKYGEIPMDDQKRLHKICIRARNIAKKLGWTVASGDHPHFKPAQGKSPRDGWAVCDMWIPRQIALLPNWKEYLSSEAERNEWLTICRTYAMTDAYRTVFLHHVFWPEIVKQKLVKQFKLQQATFAPLYAMEDAGFPCLPEKLTPQRKKLTKIIETHEQNAIKFAHQETNKSINIRSAPQVSDLLYKRWKLPVIKRTKPSKSAPQGNPSSDFDTLLKFAFDPTLTKHLPKATRKLAIGFLKEKLHYSKVKKGLEYQESYEANRIKRLIYTTIWNQGTRTVRLSSSDPNLTNIGKGGATSGAEDPEIQLYLQELSRDNESLRAVFGPEPDTFWYDTDYSQLQLRIFAFVAREKSLIDAFEAGWDAHTYVARRIFKLRDDEAPTTLQRRIAKAVNFGFIFGAQPAKIEATAGRPGLWDEVVAIFPSAHKFMEKTQWQVRKRGCVYTPGGYRLTCDKPHAGVNYIVQGSEAEIVKRALVETHRYFVGLNRGGINAKLRLMVHDEIVSSFPSDSNKLTQESYTQDGKEKIGIRLRDYTHVRTIKKIMEDAGSHYGIITPADPEIVISSWDKAHKVLGV